MKTARKVTALLMALTLALLCSACGGDTQVDITTAENTELVSSQETEAPESTDAAIEDASDVSATQPVSLTEAAQATEAASEAATEAASAISAPVGGSVAQIVEFYNEYANATKAYSGKVTISKVEGTTSTLEDISIGLLRSTAEGMLPNDYPKNSSRTFTNGSSSEGSINDFIPIDEQSKMSTLPASGVKSATCVKSGTGWKITLKLKSEQGDDINYLPPNHASCMDTLSLTSEDLEPFTLNEANITYQGATLTAVVNEKGLLDSFDVNMPVYITGKLAYKSFNLIEAVVLGTWKQTATFKY